MHIVYDINHIVSRQTLEAENRSTLIAMLNHIPSLIAEVEIQIENRIFICRTHDMFGIFRRDTNFYRDFF